VPVLLARAMADARVRESVAPGPAVANALAALDDPAAALELLHALERTATPSETRDRLVAELERLPTSA